jgi:hypothetical protein
MKKRKYETVQVTDSDDEILKVLQHQQSLADALNEDLSSTEKTIESIIAESEQHLKRVGYAIPSGKTVVEPTALEIPPLRSWTEILADAEKDVQTEVSLADFLTENEISEAEQVLEILRGEFDAEHRLDGMDWAIAGVAGVLAALVDTFLVKMPSSPGLLGGKDTTGGALSDHIRERVRQVYTPAQIKVLEQNYRVPFDAANSAYLAHKVSGLSPGSHRFQSLGHDPILGFLFGVYDILHGTMTAVDLSGKLIGQTISSPDSSITLFQAIAQEFGHLLSDISTPTGLPAPLMPLLQFIQVGSYGEQERTVGEIAWTMYRKGYNFNHFLAMSVPVLMIEVLVRFGYCTKRLMEGYDLDSALPMNLPGKPHQPKLQTMLFVAHLISTSINVGRLSLTGNPLTINYPQWMMMAKVSIQQLNWALFVKEEKRSSFVQSKLDQDWNALNRDMSMWWEKSDPDTC